MIELLAALSIQTAFQQEGQALVDQSLQRILTSYTEMVETLGQCSTVYPGGGLHPYVMQAREDVRSIGSRDLATEASRIDSVRFAEVAAARKPRGLTVSSCAACIEADAETVSTHVQGLKDLFAALERDRSR